MHNFDVGQELDFGGELLAALLAGPLLLVAAQDPVLEGPMSRPTVRGCKSRRAVPTLKRLLLVNMLHLQNI